MAARHVRAQKSGFLTVISLLSISGVGVSSFALCAVVSIMGGFGADLKHKILGNNAHVKIEAKRIGGFEHWSDLLEEVRLVKGVHAATPVASGEAMAVTGPNGSVASETNDAFGRIPIRLRWMPQQPLTPIRLHPARSTHTSASEPSSFGSGYSAWLLLVH